MKELFKKCNGCGDYTGLCSGKHESLDSLDPLLKDKCKLAKELWPAGYGDHPLDRVRYHLFQIVDIMLYGDGNIQGYINKTKIWKRIKQLELMIDHGPKEEKEDLIRRIALALDVDNDKISIGRESYTLLDRFLMWILPLRSAKNDDGTTYYKGLGKRHYIIDVKLNHPSDVE